MTLAIIAALILAAAAPPMAGAETPAPAVDEYLLDVPGSSGSTAGSSGGSASPAGSVDGGATLQRGVAGESATSESPLESLGSTLIPGAPALIALTALALIAVATLVPRLRAE